MLVNLPVMTCYNVYKRYVANGNRFVDGRLRNGTHGKGKLVGALKEYLLQQKTLQDWVGYSLTTRCFIIERDWNVIVDYSTLRQFYIKHGIKNYSLSYTYQQSFKHQEERWDEVQAFVEKLGTAISSGDLVAYFDSASFNMWIRNRKSWSRYEQPVKFVMNEKRCSGITVMGAISEHFTSGPLFIQSQKATSSERFLEFLPKLRAKFPLHSQTRIKLVLDNATAHRTPEVVEMAKKCKIDLWYMPAYTPELNSIETVWSVIKRDFKRRIAFLKQQCVEQAQFSKLLKESCDIIT